MKCQNCGKNEATFYYRSSINGRVMESHLCPECARQLGLVQDMRRPMMSSFWDDDDFFTRPFRMLEPLLGGFGSRLLTEFPEPVDVTQQAAARRRSPGRTTWSRATSGRSSAASASATPWRPSCATPWKPRTSRKPPSSGISCGPCPRRKRYADQPKGSVNYDGK